MEKTLNSGEDRSIAVSICEDAKTTQVDSGERTFINSFGSSGISNFAARLPKKGPRDVSLHEMSCHGRDSSVGSDRTGSRCRVVPAGGCPLAAPTRRSCVFDRLLFPDYDPVSATKYSFKSSAPIPRNVKTSVKFVSEMGLRNAVAFRVDQEDPGFRVDESNDDPTFQNPTKTTNILPQTPLIDGLSRERSRGSLVIDKAGEVKWKKIDVKIFFSEQRSLDTRVERCYLDFRQIVSD